MGVFNGNSIYKDGGAVGGGGYNDGGSLTPADYIEIENNSFYKLEGNDAADLNFVIDGESGVLNSIVEISTNVDSTVNVYVKRNGFLYILSAIDNLIYSNKNYRLVISGDSYILEEIVNVSPQIRKAEFNGSFIDVYEFNGILISQDLGLWLSYNEFENLLNNNPGWEKIKIQDMQNLVNSVGIDAIRSTSGWTKANGTNTTGLNFEPLGVSSYGQMYDVGKESKFWGIGAVDGNYIAVRYNSLGSSTYGLDDNIKIRCRVKKII